MKYKIKFKHIVEITYTTEIEAGSKNDAREIFEKEPFDGDLQEVDWKGLNIQFISIEQV